MAMKKTDVKKESAEKKICSKCNDPQPLVSFYKYPTNEYSDGLYPVCKKCIGDSIDINDINDIKDNLTKLNRPYIHSLWESSIAESERRNWPLFGTYMKNVQLGRNKTLTWKDSVFESKQQASSVKNIESFPEKSPHFEFKITDEMIIRWGQKYEVDDYIKLEDFYHKMKLSNRIETHQEETYLKKLAAISLKMDKELDAGNSQQVKQLGDLFSKFMADSKFRAMDKTDADKTGGIRNFSTIFSEVEKDGHIPPWEYYRKLKNVNQDIIDKTIMHIENFTLRLNKIERMIEPPSDTPKLEDDEYDRVDE